jgi:hypothetical protein
MQFFPPGSSQATKSSNVFDSHMFVKKMLHHGAKSIKRSVYLGVGDFASPFPQPFQQNC